MEKTRSEESNDGGIDRLSNLPDAMLLHILSFLPTLTCVNTMSLVSHRYRNLWEHLQVLNVDEEDFNDLHINEDELFRYLSLFVNGFLARRKSRVLQKFHLSFNLSDLDEYETPAPYIDTWVRTATGPHLEELHLSLSSDEPDFFNFPLNILSFCPNLVSLSLCCHILPQMQLQLLCSSSAVCFPLLKKLEMRLLSDDVDVSEVDVLLSGCPILETLEVFMYPKSLNTLCVPHSLKSLTFTVQNDVGVCLEIDAPDLKYLSLTGVTFGGNAIGNLHKVEEANLVFYSLPCISVSADPLQNLLRALSRIKHLVLICSTPTNKWLFDVEFPEFQHLIHLELNLPCLKIGFLYNVLQKCPMLQALKIKKCLFDVEFPEFRHLIHLELTLPCFNIGSLYNVLQKCPMLQALKINKAKYWRRLHGSLPPLYGWAPKPKSVPDCLVSHLTFIHFIRCQGNIDELVFIQYVLRKGLVLKTMHISSLSDEKWEKNNILTQLSNIPRASVSCELKID